MSFQPLVPFEPVRAHHFPDGPQWVAQIKWDGVRLLTYAEGGSVQLFNRRCHERTDHYPELRDISTYCKAHSVILDGEVIALKQGKPSFFAVMKRDGVRQMKRVPALQRQVPIAYMVFDVLFLNGHWLTACPLKERQQRLQEILLPGETVQLVDNFPDGRALFEVMRKEDMEGVVMKDLDSSYQIAGKDGRWKKLKNFRDLIAVVGGIVRQEGQIRSLLLGLYDPSGRLWYIGHVGRGRFAQRDWRELAWVCATLAQPVPSFINPPMARRETVWLKPQLTVKVQFSEWTERRTLRHPTLQALMDVPAETCLWD